MEITDGIPVDVIDIAAMRGPSNRRRDLASARLSCDAMAFKNISVIDNLVTICLFSLLLSVKKTRTGVLSHLHQRPGMATILSDSGVGATIGYSTG